MYYILWARQTSPFILANAKQSQELLARTWFCAHASHVACDARSSSHWQVDKAMSAGSGRRFEAV